MDKVLVVGGRTTGLMMASELARRGIPVRCIDKSPGIDPHVRANLLHSRTLEILQGLGLDEKVTLGSVAEIGFVFYRNGERVGESPHAPIDSPFPYGMSQSQAHTEATLESHLETIGGKVERDVSLTALIQDDAGVNVTLQHCSGREETARYQWVIACDGAHSTVRHHLDEAFPGDADDIPYILGDVLIDGDEDLEPDKGHVFFHDDGVLFAFTRLPENRHFLVASLAKEAGTDGEPTLEQLQTIVSQRAGASLRLRDPHWLGFFRINYRLVPRYRQDRIFLAGDAAHVHSLLAGQGMNTGIQDAHNLAWKLAQVVRGRESAALLDTYEAERRSVAAEVIETTRKITQAMESYADLPPGDRETFISHLYTPEAARLDAARHLQEVDLDYSASPLSVSPADFFQSGPGPGVRAPDATDLVYNGKATSLFKLPADDQFRLFFFCGTSDGPAVEAVRKAADAARDLAGWLKPYIVGAEETVSAFPGHAVIIDQKRNMQRIYGADLPCIYLVRPDGYVAYCSSDLASVGTYFEQTGLTGG
ncbi:FAD-dependent monooxygenase [Roseibium sp.]|uniref:FAD-dependent monooxygenase n=1 Tax=Roseibium sp. TaxID=1936156 RepID=UPI003B5026AA